MAVRHPAMRALATVLSLLSFSVFSADVWIFLKDGRVGLGDPKQTPLRITLPDKTSLEITASQIHSQRTQAETDQAVDGMIKDIVRGQNISEHSLRLQSYRAAAAPRLLSYLKHADARMRLAALYGLQFCYVPEAEEPVFAAMHDADFDICRTAYATLVRHVSEKELARRLQPLADSPNISTAALVFESVERHFPDASLKRIQRIAADPKYRRGVLHRLSHCRDASLTPLALKFLDSTDKEIVRAGLVGLISQLADDDATRAKVRGLFASPDVDLRDLAGEYFTWLGQSTDADALQRALGKESDPYARASFEGALRTISMRADAWRANPALQHNFATLKNEGGLEPTLIYGLSDEQEPEAARGRIFRIQEALVAPCGLMRESSSFLGSVSFDLATGKLPPVHDFFDPKRKSFGLQMPGKEGPFSGSVHIGDDVSWRRELGSVVAVAPGVVRSVEHAYSWGFIVIVEHKDSDGKAFCSLYAHLSPLIQVKPGDTVKLGQKIGSVGRNQSVENGGYMAHLHFGLHDGPFLSPKGRWISGYINTDKWKEGQHGWLDPQAFLKAK